MHTTFTKDPERIRPEKLAAFMAVFGEELAKAHATNPGWYAFPASELPAVLTRMTTAMERGSYNYVSPTFKATAKRLGFKPTRTAIENFLRS